MIPDPEFANFARLIDSLSPWLDQVVVIGGWAHRLYRFHPSAQRLDYPSLSTLDTDIAVPARIAVKEQDIHDRLIANGFREEFLGNNRPPATHYHLGSEKSGFYAEFLTPLTGSARTRTGRSNATVRIGGVSSQKLRHLEILLNAPWHVDGRSRIQTSPCKRRRRVRALENGTAVFHFRTGPAAGCSHGRIMAEVKSRIDGWWNEMLHRK